MELWMILQEATSLKMIAESLLSSIMMLYGFLFISNLLCLALFLRKFFTLYNVQTGNNFVLSSSDMFSDNKGTLPMQAWLMLLIPFFYIYFIIYYSNQLKKLYPNVNTHTKLLKWLCVGSTILCLIVSFLLEYIAAAYLQAVDYIPYNRNFTTIPLVIVAIANMICDFILLKTIRENFYFPEEKTEY